MGGAVIRCSTAKILESVYYINGEHYNVAGCVVPVAKIACQLTHNLGFMACATKFRVKIAWMDDVCVSVRARMCVCVA